MPHRYLVIAGFWSALWSAGDIWSDTRASECVNYLNYAHVAAEVDAGDANNVAIDGDRLYVASGSSFWIYDISDPGSPALAGSYFGSMFARDVAVDGTYAYLSGGPGVVVLDISGPTPIERNSQSHPEYAYGVSWEDGLLAVASESHGLYLYDTTTLPVVLSSLWHCHLPGYTRDVVLRDGIAYVANSEGLIIVDLSIPTSPVVLSELDLGWRENLVLGGSHVFMDSGEIIDISDPSNPMVIADASPQGGRPALDGGHLFLTNGDVQMIDVSTPAEPVHRGAVSVHGLGGIAARNGFAFAAQGNHGVAVIDIDPLQTPGNIAYYPSIEGSGLGLEGALGATVEWEYISEWEEKYWLRVLDLTNPLVPSQVARIELPQEREDVEIHDQRAYAIGYGGLSIWDLSSPSVPLLLGSINTPGPGYNVRVAGSYAYVADGSAGVTVVNVANPQFPMIVGSIPFAYRIEDLTISGELLLASGGAHLFVADLTDPENPTPRGNVTVTESAQGIAVSDHYAFVDTYGDVSVQIVDFSNPDAPVHVAGVPLPGYASYNLAYHQGTVYVGTTDAGVLVVDVRDPYNPSWVGQNLAAGTTNELAFVDGRLLTLGYTHLAIVPTNCDETSSVDVADVPDFGRVRVIPNPSAGGAVSLSLPFGRSISSARIFDMSGRLVRRLAGNGSPDLQWDLRDARGEKVPATTYSVRIEHPGGVAYGRVVAVR